MKTEYELRVLNINIEDIIEKCKSLNAKKIGSFHQKRFVYDFSPPTKGKWIRLRNDGFKSTLAVKKIKSLNIDGTKELEIIVSNFEDTAEVLKELGFEYRNYQENYRVEFCINDVNLDIDKWPMLNPFLEIEGPNETAIYNILKLLKFEKESITFEGVDSIYLKNGINLEAIKTLSFCDEENESISHIEQLLEV